MSDALDEVLSRHRAIWRERMLLAIALSMFVGLAAGYLVRWWFG